MLIIVEAVGYTTIRGPYRLLWLAFLLHVLACGGPSPSEVSTSEDEVTLFAGGIAADTVDAEGLISVRVNGSSGGLDGVTVRFRAVWIDESHPEDPLLLSAGSATFFHWLPGISRETSDGRTEALVRYGTVAGGAGVEVTVPSLGLADTVTAEIMAGAVNTIAAEPADTVVYLGAEYDLEVAAVDRYGNPVPGVTPALNVVYGSVDVDSNSGVVRATALGVDRMVLTIPGSSRNVDIAVAPELTMAYAQGGRLFVSDLAVNERRDVLERDRIMGNNDSPQHAWSLDGTLLAYTDSARIYVDDLSGTRWPIADGDDVGGLSWTADNAWVYFADQNSTWRAAVDGSGVVFVTNGRGEVSPDGTYLALYRAPELLLYDIPTGSTAVLHDDLRSFSWSPDGTRLSISTAAGGIEVIDTSGTVVSTLAAPLNPTGGTSFGFADSEFSPDGRFLVVEAHEYLWLLDVQRERVFQLPLPKTSGAADPSLSPFPLNQ